MMKIRARKFVILTVFLVILITYTISTYFLDYRQSRNCFNTTFGDDNVLEDILHSKNQPKNGMENFDLCAKKITNPWLIPGKNIFFHETSCSDTGIVQLTARQSCAIESAARANPNWNVFVLFASPVGFRNKSTLPIIDALLQYPNVHLRFLNITTYAEQTPLSEWMKSGEIFRSSYMNSHLSDILRYLSLWKYGGTYLDLDVVVKKTFENIPSNYAGAESERFVAAGLINFDHMNFGHQLADMCLHDLLENYNGREWGNNGPGVITRVLKRICNTNTPQQMTLERCYGFKVFPINAIYAVGWIKHRYFFEERYLEETLKLLNESIVVHVWNNFSKHLKIKVGSKVTYAVLANEYCPRVYKSCGENF